LIKTCLNENGKAFLMFNGAEPRTKIPGYIIFDFKNI
jgi:hypothetical protein